MKKFAAILICCLLFCGCALTGTVANGKIVDTRSFDYTQYEPEIADSVLTDGINRRFTALGFADAMCCVYSVLSGVGFDERHTTYVLNAVVASNQFKLTQDEINKAMKMMRAIIERANMEHDRLHSNDSM